MTHLAVQFNQVFAVHAHRPATRVRAGDTWIVQTFRQLQTNVRRLANGLLDAGIQRGDRIAILSQNRPEWTQVDLAIMSVGAIPVPIYATSSSEQISHVVNDSGSRLLIIGGAAEADRVIEARPQMPTLERVISMDQVDRPGIVSLADVAVPGRMTVEQSARLDAVTADLNDKDLCAIIYTSGTTGSPKGVMLSHAALSAEMDALDVFFTLAPSDHSLCFLPLSHALERVWTTYVLLHGCMVTYVTNPKEVARMLVLARPTLLVSVPKLYETVLATARSQVAGSTVKRDVFNWALRVGGSLQHSNRKGEKPSWIARAQLPLADRLVLKNIRDAMGGPKTVLACGGAPVRLEVEEFFSAAGIPFLNGYGTTEAAPLISFNRPNAFKLGTAGQVMPGGEIGIGEDGEILYRGPNVMDGYWNDPEGTAAAFHQGWLRTGDVGYVDVDGFLVITDRLKDIIVTINGKNIAPQPIEGLLLSDPLFEYAVLLGDNRPCLTLLVKPSVPHLLDLAARLNVPFSEPRELLSNAQIVEAIRERIRRLTSRLPSHEQIRDLRVLLEDFTMENGLLTPTLKVKRREVEKHFAKVIDEMYAMIGERRRAAPEKPGGQSDESVAAS